jgi:hypothetical protein
MTKSFCTSPGRHIVTSTPETDALETIYYEMVEQIVDAANTFVDMHPTSSDEQVKKMMHLFISVTAAFIDSMPGLQETTAIDVAKLAFQHAKELENKPKNESYN